MFWGFWMKVAGIGAIITGALAALGGMMRGARKGGEARANVRHEGQRADQASHAAKTERAMSQAKDRSPQTDEELLDKMRRGGI